MPKVFIRKSSTWPEIKSIFVKKTTGWAEVKNVFIKKTTGWVKVFTKLSLPDTTTSPSIRTTNTSGVGDAYDGPVAGSLQFLNTNLYGKDGLYTNYTSIFGRKFTSGTTSSALTRSTVVTGDLFTSGGGVTTTDRTNLDNKYLFYELTVQNGSSANEIYPISSAIKMIKSYPALTDMGWAEAEQVGTQLVLNYDIENYYYNKIDPALSYVRWWRSSTTNAGGTLIQEETITATTTGTPTSTQRLGTSYYTPTSLDIGYYIVAEITGRSSHTEHYGYTDNYMMGSYPTGGPIGAALTVTGVSFTDSNDRSGKNARGNLVTATTTKLNWTVNGVNTGTTFRVRYRVLNNQTGLYYNPNDPTTALAAGSAWLSYTDNYYGSGTINSVSVSGTTATIYDQFTIDQTFNGSTYGGGISRWSFQYEISVVSSSGTRLYWQYPNSMSTTQTNDYWDIDPTTNPSISASPATIAPGGTVTFSGTFNPYPAALSSYPHSYRIVYGDGANSGWITLGSSPANQTYSNNKVYNTAGSYFAYIETTPYYTYNGASVTVASQLTAPTISSVTPGPQGGAVSVAFTGGSGPFYQAYWNNTVAPSSGVTPDASGSSSPLTDNTGPSYTSTAYMYVRSVLTAGETSVGPSSLASAWSAGVAFNMTSTAVTQSAAPTTRATNTYSTSTVKYLDSITWSSGSYTNQASKTSVLLYSTSTSNLVSPGGNTNSSFRSTSPYTIQTSDPAGTPYVFAVRDTVVGTNGTTYYFYSNQITSALADAVAFSYGTATSQSGGWTASINSGTQTGATYSLSSGTGTVNSSTGQVTVTGLGPNTTTSVIVTKSVSGYNTASATATGTASPPAKLSTPTGVTASDNRTDGINITWNAVSGASYYGVWWGGAPSYDSAPDFQNIFGTSYLDSGAPVGSRNYYVQAFASGNPTGTKSDWGGPDSGTRLAVVVTPAPAITSGPSISWASGNNFTLSATASNATNLEFQVEFANNSGGPALSTQTFFFGASSGGGTTGAQSYSWARTRVRANNSSTGLSSSFSGYTGWA